MRRPTALQRVGRIGRVGRIALAAVLLVTVAGCVSRDVPFPDRVLDPEVVGVVTERQQGSVPTARIYEVDGQFVEIDSATGVELAGGGLGEGRLLIVARDDDTTYYLGLVKSDRMSAHPDCHELIGAAAWETPEGVVFRFAPADIGLRLPAAPEFSPETGSTGRIARDERFCITPDGQVHAPTAEPAEESLLEPFTLRSHASSGAAQPSRPGRLVFSRRAERDLRRIGAGTSLARIREATLI